jgi:hypothetical protein
MKQKIQLTLLLFAFSIFTLKAQDRPFQQWAAGINAGLYGAGVQAATSLHPHLRLRAGFDYLTYTHSEAITLETTAETTEGYEMTIEGEISEAAITFPNFKALVDYYPMSNGIFCLTGGFYLGSNSISANGLIRDYEQLKEQLGDDPEFEYEDIAIRPDNDGTFEGKLWMGKSFKPYIGLGLGRTIPHNRIGFKVELGMVYQGKYRLESSNVNEAGEDWLDSLVEEEDFPVSRSMLNWWPMLNLSLTCRIH